ncbi:non-ribosomal peptide synthetase [Polymorphospora sp. NPDC051019]|uniref:non-ribosomal peptide synthetase n=1 Tax=Polymorphospora sp. NPDC051019 TaxID=3155725 RepID=UPI0034269426
MQAEQDAVPPLVVPGDTRSVTRRFRDVARRIPELPALVSPDGAYTFGATDTLSDRIATHLRPDRPGDPLAVLLPQTADGLLGLLGALKSGRPVVLLDPTLPADRLRQIVDRSGATGCLTDADHRATAATIGVPALVDLAPALAAPAADPYTADPAPYTLDPNPHRPNPAAARATGPAGLAGPAGPAGTDPALVVFTSGSTGRPKGVVLTHDMLLNEAYGGLDRLHISPADRVALVLPAAFMAGLTVLVFALLNGAGVYAYDPRVRGIRDLPAWLAAQGVTTVHLTPSLLRSLLAVLGPGQRLDGLRLVTTCGEAVHGRDVAALRPHLPAGCTYTSWSGSSEIGHLAFHPIAPADPVPEGIVPVGRPAPGKDVTLLGDDGHPVPDGGTGELVVTSAYLSAGYWNAPEETAARFTPLPDGRVAYRTGDLGRFDADGTLHLMGRRDSAVKIRGYLVEPAEVEAALLASPLVAEAVVVATRNGTEPVALTAYVAPHRTAGTPAPATLRRFLRERLPSWMVPAAIVVLPGLPRNERGKVDRVALPPPPPEPDAVPPRSHWEVIVADLWAHVLDLESVGIHDDFMRLGGDSLAAEELLAAAQDRLGIRLTSADLAQAPTVAEFARLVADSSRAAPRHPTTVTLRAPAAGTAPGGGDADEPPLFCFAGAGGLGFSFLPLARRLPGTRPVHAIQAYGLENRGRPDWSVRAAARRHLRTVRELRPHGPYLLAGHSLGGLIAIEVAHELAAAGEDVPLLVVLDSYLPADARKMTYAGPTARDEPAPDRAGARLRRAVRGLRATADGLRGDSRELWSYRLRLPLAGVVPFDGITQYGVFFEQGHLLTRRHRVRPWPGRALLFLAADHPDDGAGWTDALTGPVDVHRVACDHPSVLREPHVGTVAARVADAVAALQPAGAAR